MIELSHVTKSYPTPHGRRYVFRDLSFRFPDDASIGLIGPNGAGKSTLMRLLGGIDAPDHGRVVSDVNISWPVGLSGGMQGALSGRDNVRFVCRIYGAVGKAMRKKMAEVEAFAEIGEYFDLPVKSYSSGMRSRLAFGLSMAFDFDYYLIDEVMAVGDAQFRTKCQAAFKSRLEKANLILVSHNMRDIREWCDVVVLIKNGGATLYEDVEAGILAYQGPIDNVALRREAKAKRDARAARAAALASSAVAPAAPVLNALSQNPTETTA
ncbi:MAG: ABC transporter ATP-binding protein [Methylibium petroleiphilum]